METQRSRSCRASCQDQKYQNPLQFPSEIHTRRSRFPLEGRVLNLISVFSHPVDQQPGDRPQVQLVAVQRAGAAAAHLPRSHQADPQELPQSGAFKVPDSANLRGLSELDAFFEKRPTPACVLRVLQVIIMDPTQEYTAELLSVAEMFYANNIPLRFVSESPCMGFPTTTYLFDKTMLSPLFSLSLCTFSPSLSPIISVVQHK